MTKRPDLVVLDLMLSDVSGEEIRIDGDYEPAEVHSRAGEPARLIFRREETAPCSERVVFPDA